MSSESPNPSPEKFLKSLTDAVDYWIRWIVELIRRRDWYMLLIVFGIGLALLAHSARDYLNQVIKEEFQPTFWLILWGGVGVIFIVALGMALLTLPLSKATMIEDLADRKAIKGLRPFGSADAAIFTQLQRDRILRNCIEVITSAEFQFGILVGESGCGKTSFLLAGVLPQLMKSEHSICGVYVRFSNQDPITAIQKALAEKLEIPMDWLSTTNENHAFLGLLTQAITATNKPIVLFLDQFEQWYVHAKQPEERQPLLQGLVDWHEHLQNLPVRILISMRSDLYFHIVEIQQALKLNLGPQDIFHLAKFTPAEATKVLAIIASTEKLQFEESFVLELAEQELAGREDSLISPVDVQILAWMIERQNAQELRAFSRQAFQKFGGVEGLLIRFLDQALMARVSQVQRQAALKVLLALVDLDKQVKAGVLTISDLLEKLVGSLSHPEVSEAVKWLARGDVRLITPVEQNEVMGYELAHDQLIPALMHKAGRELSVADKANQLLNRRVNEWLGNNRSRRYLFGPRELWLIERQKPYLVWGLKQQPKEKLLALSWYRLYKVAGLLITLMLSISVFLGWLWHTPEGQIQQVRWNLVNLQGGVLARVSDEDAANAAVAFAKDGRKQKALEIVLKYVERSIDQASFFKQFATQLTHERDKKKIQDNLELAEVQIDKIEDPSHKAYALSAIAATYAELRQTQLANKTLKKALIFVRQIDKPNSTPNALKAFTAVSDELQQTQLAKEILDDTLKTVDKIIDPNYKSDALMAISAAYNELKQPQLAGNALNKALQTIETVTDSSFKTSVLREIAANSADLKDDTLIYSILSNILTATNRMDDPRYKSEVLSAMAAAVVIKDDKLLYTILNNILKAANTIENASSQSDVFSTIAITSAELKDEKLISTILVNILEAANRMANPRAQSKTLEAISEAAAHIKNNTRAHIVLSNTLLIANKIDEPHAKSYALRAISAAYAAIQDDIRAYAVLKNTLVAAKKMDDPRSTSYALSAIATSYSELKNTKLTHELLGNALIATDRIDDPSSQSDALSAIATASAQLQDIKLAQAELANTLKAAEAVNAAPTLEVISVKYAYFYNWGRALQALRHCPESLKVKALTKILTLWAEHKNPKLIDGAVILEQPKVTKDKGSYYFQANLYGPTKNCKQYIDWWEILNKDQELLDRRMLNNSHNTQQPFADKSNPLQVARDQELLVRAHLHLEDKEKSGYEARQAWTGTIKDGFKMIRLSDKFATDLAKANPQPHPCKDRSLT